MTPPLSTGGLIILLGMLMLALLEIVTNGTKAKEATNSDRLGVVSATKGGAEDPGR